MQGVQRTPSQSPDCLVVLVLQLQSHLQHLLPTPTLLPSPTPPQTRLPAHPPILPQSPTHLPLRILQPILPPSHPPILPQSPTHQHLQLPLRYARSSSVTCPTAQHSTCGSGVWLAVSSSMGTPMEHSVPTIT